MKKIKLKTVLRKEGIALIVILVIFTFFGLYLIFRVRPGISPDENYHINVSELYSKTSLIPQNSSDSYKFGDITRIPYLTFWLNARLINLNFTHIPNYIILRLFNLLVGVGSLIVVYLISKEIIGKKYWNVVPVFFLSNTLMFVFLSSSVSYDNMSNFFIFLTFYYLVKYLKTKENTCLFSIVIFQSFALLSKVTVIPVVVMELFLLLFFLIRQKRLRLELGEAFSKHKGFVFVVLFVLIFIALLYGVNFFRYGTLQPKCDDILTVEQCMSNGIYSRSQTLTRYTYTDVSSLLEILRSRMTPYKYLTNWILAMVERTYGILGHKSLLMNSYFANLYIALFVMMGIIMIRDWRKEHVLESTLLCLFLFYTGVLILYQNYRSYLHRNLFDLALQGRYIFPVLPILYIILTRYLSTFKQKWLRIAVIVVAVIIFLLGNIPFFFTFLPENWFI